MLFVLALLIQMLRVIATSYRHLPLSQTKCELPQRSQVCYFTSAFVDMCCAHYTAGLLRGRFKAQHLDIEMALAICQRWVHSIVLLSGRVALSHPTVRGATDQLVFAAYASRQCLSKLWSGF